MIDPDRDLRVPAVSGSPQRERGNDRACRPQGPASREVRHVADDGVIGFQGLMGESWFKP
jgi:hypothetical protein